MSRLSLLCILPHPFASAAHVLTRTLRCGSKRCANLLCKSCAVALRRFAFPQAPRHLSEGAPTACTYTVSGSISLPSQGFFSPFPHGTGSLSVSQEYLALEDGPPMFSQRFTCADLLDFTAKSLSCTGLSPTMATLSRVFH